MLPIEERTPDNRARECLLGLDLGQSSDPSAVTVTDQYTPLYENMHGEVQHRGDPAYAVRWIERFDLGTPYRDVVKRVAALKRAPETGESPTLVMDATGVGAPVTEMFDEEGLHPEQIVFTSGNRVNTDGDVHRVPKKDLATTVQALLQSGRIQIAEGLDGAPQLVTEMKRFRVKYTDAGNARFEHANESDSDDVLLSLACALWWADARREAGFVIV